jgi:hypothetical protein
MHRAYISSHTHYHFFFEQSKRRHECLKRMRRSSSRVPQYIHLSAYIRFLSSGSLDNYLGNFHFDLVFKKHICYITTLNRYRHQHCKKNKTKKERGENATAEMSQVTKHPKVRTKSGASAESFKRACICDTQLHEMCRSCVTMLVFVPASGRALSIVRRYLTFDGSYG